MATRTVFFSISIPGFAHVNPRPTPKRRVRAFHTSLPKVVLDPRLLQMAFSAEV
jgi:hypothetical protein